MIADYMFKAYYVKIIAVYECTVFLNHAII